MPLPSDQMPPDANYLMQRLAKLERELSELRSARSAEATSIGQGGIVIRGGGVLRMVDDDGVEMIRIGVDSATGKQVIRIRREGGTNVMFTAFASGGRQYWGFTDNNNNIVMSDDAFTGQGLARPYLSIPWHPRDDQYGFYSTTTNGTFTTVDEVRWVKQHPRINFIASTKTSDGASTGEWQIVQNDPGGSTVVVASGTIAAGGTGISTRFSVSGGHMSALSLDLQIKRLTGAGSVGALVKSITGEQS